MTYTKEQVIALADQLTCHPASRSIDEIEMAGDMLKTIVMQRDELLAALENCRLLAARHRKEDWALLILGFCAEGGVVGSITR